MKSNKLIVALLAVLLAVNAIGTVMTVIEEKEQTRIALKTAELAAIQADMLAYEQMAENSGMNEKDRKDNIGENAWLRNFDIKEIQGELGIRYLYHEMTYTYGKDGQADNQNYMDYVGRDFMNSLIPNK